MFFYLNGDKKSIIIWKFKMIFMVMCKSLISIRIVKLKVCDEVFLFIFLRSEYGNNVELLKLRKSISGRCRY